MRPTKVLCAPDVYMITLPVPWRMGGRANAYLIKDGDEALLVDAGVEDEDAWGQLEEALSVLQVRWDKLSVFLTHLHKDHAGLAARLGERGVPIFVGAAECKAESGRADKRDEDRRRFCAEGFEADWVDRLFVSMWREPVSALGRNIRFVCEGDVLCVGRYRFIVAEMAGHTPGHTVLFGREGKLLFSGDHLLAHITPVLEVISAPANIVEIYCRNLKRVADAGVTTVFPGHGVFSEDVGERVEWLAAHHRNRMNSLEQRIGMTPALNACELVRCFRWTTRQMPWRELRFNLQICVAKNTLAYLDQLGCDGRIAKKIDQNGLWRYYLASA